MRDGLRWSSPSAYLWWFRNVIGRSASTLRSNDDGCVSSYVFTLFSRVRMTDFTAGYPFVHRAGVRGNKILNSHYMYRQLTQVQRVDLSVLHAYSNSFCSVWFSRGLSSRDAIDRVLLAFLIDWLSDQHTLVKEVISRLGGLVCLCFLPMPLKQPNAEKGNVSLLTRFERV